MNPDELNALEREAADLDAAAHDSAEPKPEEPKSEGQGSAQIGEVLPSAEEEAAMLVDLLAWAVEKIWPVLAYKDETKSEAAKKLAPLVVKYNLNGLLFAKWQAEIEAGLFFGGLAIASVKAVQESKAAEAEQREREKSGWIARFFRWGKD